MKYPFRLGTTSFIIPDNIIPNARYLAEKVDDIQLILFESDEVSLPNDSDVAEMKEIATPHNTRYSIHFPLDTILGAEEPLRSESIKKHIDIINTTLPLNPSVYIVHFNGDDENHRADSPSDNIERWRNHNRKSMIEILQATGVDPSKFCVETLAYPYTLVEDIVTDLNLSVCLDIGHLLVNDRSVEDHLDRYLDKTKSIHLHGTNGPKDHIDLSYLTPETLDLVLTRIANRDLNLTIEVFNEADFIKSMEVIESYYK